MKYDLNDRFVVFATSIIKLCKNINDNAEENRIQKRQLLRSATSAGLNYAEAQSSESSRDFVHKSSICLKELRESKMNLRIIKSAGILGKPECLAITNEVDELIAIMFSSIRTAKNNQERKLNNL